MLDRPEIILVVSQQDLDDVSDAGGAHGNTDPLVQLWVITGATTEGGTVGTVGTSGRVVGPGLLPGGIARRSIRDLALLVTAIRRRGLIGLHRAGHMLDPATLARHVDAFTDRPELAASAVALPSDPASPEATLPPGRSSLDEDPQLLDGRNFGRELLFGVRDLGGRMSPFPFLVRTSAVDDWVDLDVDDVEIWWGRLVLEACLRGPVWMDLDGCHTSPNSPVEDHWLKGRRWEPAVAHALRLGLLDGKGDVERALRYRTRRTATLLTEAADHHLPDPVDPLDMLDQVIAEWRDLRVGAWAELPEDPAAPSPTPSMGNDWLPRSVVHASNHRFQTFVLVAPDYTEAHGGVVAIHRLCDRLNVLGYRAYLEPIGEHGTIRPGWTTPLRRGRRLDDAVAIYPEIVTGNLLGAPRVVRWLLNRPGWFTGLPMDEDPDDLVVTFDPQIAADRPVLRVPLIDPTMFFPKDRPGRGKLLWIGKGRLPDDFDRSGTTLITASWPSDRAALARLLRGADVLYSCDWLTSIIDEALLCGTPVVLIGEQGWSREEVLLRPGMIWGDHDLDRARAEVSGYADDYRRSLDLVDTSVEEFVQLVNDHFGKDLSVAEPGDSIRY
jgi:hypothetical protein